MSAITINQKNSKNFAKRLQKFLNQQYNLNLNLRAAQEDFSQIMASRDWHEFNLLLERQNIDNTDKKLNLFEDKSPMGQVMSQYSQRFLSDFLDIAQQLYIAYPDSNIKFKYNPTRGYELDFFVQDNVIFTYSLSQLCNWEQYPDINLKLQEFKDNYFKQSLEFTQLSINQYTQLSQATGLTHSHDLFDSNTIIHISASSIKLLDKKEIFNQIAII